MIRTVVLIIAVWTIVGAPSLCQAGLLLHGCHDSVCSHETSCDSDPCGKNVLKEGMPGKNLTSPLPFLAPTPYFTVIQDRAEERIPVSRTGSSSVLHSSLTLPLLI